MVDLSKFCVTPEAVVADVIELLDRNQQGLALVVDAHRRLVNTVTDGDLRRAFHQRVGLREPISSVLPRVKRDPHRTPLTARVGTPREELLKLLDEHALRQLPLLDDDDCVVDIAFRSDLMRGAEPSVQAVIMAGGLGTRLRPLTDDVPKPMLHVGGRPLLEHLVQQIRDCGIRKVNITTNYQPDKIHAHFGDGGTFGLEVGYVSEDQPLGTAGSLRLLKDRDGPILVVNGDILTNVNFRAMVDYHRDHRAGITMGVVTHDVRVPFGVVESDGDCVSSISEKPVYQYFVNAGIYVVSPEIIDVIPATGRMDMTELIQLLLDRNMRVVPFTIAEYWLDIGRLEDFETAQQDLSSGRFRRSGANG
jgi:dTDP-glucose pyrophosphorylase/CBS domain-containing protein